MEIRENIQHINKEQQECACPAAAGQAYSSKYIKKHLCQDALKH